MFRRGCSKRTFHSFRNFLENFTNPEAARPCLCSNRRKESKTVSISNRRNKFFFPPQLLNRLRDSPTLHLMGIGNPVPGVRGTGA